MDNLRRKEMEYKSSNRFRVNYIAEKREECLKKEKEAIIEKLNTKMREFTYRQLARDKRALNEELNEKSLQFLGDLSQFNSQFCHSNVDTVVSRDFLVSPTALKVSKNLLLPNSHQLLVSQQAKKLQSSSLMRSSLVRPTSNKSITPNNNSSLEQNANFKLDEEPSRQHPTIARLPLKTIAMLPLTVSNTLLQS